jgi:hypothetical protein
MPIDAFDKITVHKCKFGPNSNPPEMVERRKFLEKGFGMTDIGLIFQKSPQPLFQVN